jgi:hypothetical protein
MATLASYFARLVPEHITTTTQVEGVTIHEADEFGNLTIERPLVVTDEEMYYSCADYAEAIKDGLIEYGGTCVDCSYASGNYKLRCNTQGVVR